LRANAAGRVCKHVLGERDVRLGNPIAQAIFYHRLGTACDFFGRLKECDERAAPGWPCLSEEFRRAKQTRHMRVMTTSMAHTGGPAMFRRRGDCRRVR
jgi:hypothetical protein